MKIKVKYNAPVTLTFSLGATIILLLQTAGINVITKFFLVPPRGGFDFSSPIHYITLVGHSLGHASWSHLMGNLAFLLLLGPILEEKHGSWRLLSMIFITALTTGLMNIFFFPYALLGASGIVFMMILLASFTNIRNGEIPLTFILILILYLTTEVVNAFKADDVSQFAHIVGGVLGSLFGFLGPAKPKKPQQPEL